MDGEEDKIARAERGGMLVNSPQRKWLVSTIKAGLSEPSSTATRTRTFSQTKWGGSSESL